MPQHNDILTIVRYYALPTQYRYSEFLGSKALTDTTIFSALHQSFCNRSYSSVQAELFTDLYEIRAICELIGLQGVQFFDEKLSRMIAVLTGNLKVISFSGILV